ncbi:hypothetical protein ASG37_05460 [Sphingomonas sp. Leaf407]|uniref:hypothetical protein n=1 Tax=unclassified Sphingomonas TaxID=196159 RepID=UPI0006FDAE98|nr:MULTISPECIES: hypothetical protein [unclassified Sphingomonas]KQN37096.1 hypothetical protein ASE97_11375 [Sphingomonas sp. Leaf42]KQT30523.1 hypothetical protein ASG37_05460 [Sphingomonas sp. Leaf407]
MKIDIGAACREALGIWRRDRDMIVAVSGVFFFLPNFALALFLSRGDDLAAAQPGDQQAMVDALQAYLVGNAHWLVLQAVAELVGIATLLALVLDPARPSVREALLAAFRRLPLLIVAMLLIYAAKLAGLLLFVLPLLYVIGRVFVVLPVLIAEPQRRFGDAMQHAITLTAGQVVPLLALSGLLYFGAQLVVLLLSGTAGAISSGGGNPVTLAMLSAAVAAVGAAMSVAFTLVRATVYRRLSSKG